MYKIKCFVKNQTKIRTDKIFNTLLVEKIKIILFDFV